MKETLTEHQVNKELLARLLSQQETGQDWESLSTQDWSQVVKLSEREGIGPQLYWVLSKSEKLPLLPKACQDRLRAMFVATRLNNLQILDELSKLSALFNQQGIPVVALKGICFVLTIYPDIGMRPMVDLDLLVPASRLPEAIRIAYDLGYEKAFPEATPGLDELLNHAACLAKAQTPFTTLEIHHTLVGEEAFRHAVPVDWFWTQTEPLHESSTEWKADYLLMLTPTAQLLYACAHAMLQHGGRNASLRWMYDLDCLVRVYLDRVNWKLLLSQAREFEWSSASAAALLKLVDLFDTPIPKGVIPALTSHVDRNMERVTEMQTHPATHTREEYQKYISLHWLGRIKLFLGLAFPGPAYMRRRYGLNTNWMLPLWYPYRWLSIFMDLLKTAWIFAIGSRL